MENNFKKQIADDIALIQSQFSYIDDKILKDEYAFNYWVLSRLYSLDEELIPNNVTDIKDKGIDCWVHYEDTKELFLIQNKYDSENTPVPRDNVSDFLYSPLRILLKGEYRKSPELQKIFDRAISDSEYKIWLHFYVTNDYTSEDIDTLIDKFNFDKNDDPRIEASIYAKYSTLSDIQRIYFGDRFTEKKHFSAKLPTRRAATSLDVRPDDYELEWMIDLRYVLVNVVDIYEIYKQAIEKNYELFEENIREYLGTQGINNGIIKTLKDSVDRANFFYYNNGITIICEKCETIKGTDVDKDGKNIYGFKLDNPQIVNGCQTVNSIAEVLSHCPQDKLFSEFSKAFVLVKVFVFDADTKQKHPNLDVNIVRYTNSQNAISDKAFASKHNYFLNIQSEFKTRGLLLLVKPSDKNKFKTEYDKLMAKNISGLIIDVRNNPGGLVTDTVSILKEMLPKCDIVKLVYKDESERVYKCDGKNKINIPVAVLVNSSSASASEILASAIKDSQIGVLIGTKTYGKGIVQEVQQLDGKGALSITVAKYYTASGVEIHKNGIEPNITVELPKEYEKSNNVPRDKDTQLKKALEYLREKM